MTGYWSGGAMNIVCFGSLAAVLGYLVAMEGGVGAVRPVVSFMVVSLVGVMFWAVRPRVNYGWPVGMVSAWCLFAAALCVQVIPLPASVVNLISPERGFLISMLEEVGYGGVWHPLSVNSTRTFEYLARYTALFVCSITIAAIARDSRFGPAVLSLPVYGLCLAEVLFTEPLKEATFWAGTFVNPNHMAALLNLGLPFLIVLSWSAYQNKTLTGAIMGLSASAGSVLLLAGIGSTSSRAGFAVSGLVTCVVGACLYGRYVPSGNMGFRRVGAAGVVIMLVVAALGFTASPAMLLEVSRGVDSGSSGITGRLELWATAIGVFLKYPVVGCGVGAFRSAAASVKPFPMMDVDYAHNEYLQILAESGVLGCTLVLVLLSKIMMHSWETVLRESSASHWGTAVACLAALIGMSVHSLVDFSFQIPAVSLATAWVVGLSLRG